jgi:hypothetical protein
VGLRKWNPNGSYSTQLELNKKAASTFGKVNVSISIIQQPLKVILCQGHMEYTSEH